VIGSGNGSRELQAVGCAQRMNAQEAFGGSADGVGGNDFVPGASEMSKAR